MNEKEELRPALSWKDALLALAEANKEIEELKSYIRRDLELEAMLEKVQVIHRIELEKWKMWAEKLNDTLEDMWNQFAYRGIRNGKEILVNGGLSALEGCQESLSDFQKFKESKEKS